MQDNGQSDTQELEAGFNSLALESEGFASTKKIWGVEDKHTDETAKALFINDAHQWGRDSTWSSGPSSANAPGENGGLSDHAVSQPIMVKRGSNVYGADGTLLSPRSTDTGGIGMKMAEYVLNNSPSSKDNLDSRIHARLLRDHEKVSSANARLKAEKDSSNVGPHSTQNGIANGFGGQGEEQIFNRAPGIPHQIDSENVSMMPGVGHHHQPQFSDFSGDQLGSGPMPNIDGLPSFGANDYVNHLLPPGTDSPNPLIDAYTNNLYSQQRNAGGAQGQANNQMSMLSNQQHMSMAQQNLGPTGATASIGHPSGAPTANNNIFTAVTQSAAQNPYFSDPFMSHMLAAGAPGPAALAMAQQYYGFPTAWNMYPGMLPNATTASGGMPNHPSSMQQQVRGANNQNSANRPMSPSNVNDHNSASSQALAAIQAQAAANQNAGFPMIPLPGTPSGFYDQNSMSALAAAGRGLPPSAMHRMMQPLNLLQNPAAMGNGNMRMMPNANQGGPAQTQANPLFPPNGQVNGNANGMYPSATNSGLGYNNMAPGIFSANGHPNGPQQMGFHNPGTIY